MKDAILNGTGDSRYLKSKIPTGTTWEQALAMLNAGTFPVDLNGINSEGFQQLGTPLNKANLLKDAVVSKLGLTGDKTPNDMFGVLADVGNLHVWRKTVTTTEEVPAVPAGYTLGDVETNLVVASSWGTVSVFGVAFSWAETPTVDSSTGEVSLGSNPSGGSYYNITSSSWTDLRDDFNDGVVGNFCTLRHNRESGNTITDLLFVPSDSVMTRETVDADNYKYNIVFSKAQRVTGYPYTPAIPAGTSVTYPVSTNRNAYQEGSDAKSAGYVLGDVVSGTFELRPASGNETTFWSYGEALSVSNDGTISISSSTGSEDYVTLGDSSTTTVKKARLLLGKYVSPSGSVPSPFVREAVYFIPSDAEINLNTSGLGPFVSKYQPVTGYAAIPAGTVIEYLGCLGAKPNIQLISYVGTGTYGSDHPCSITANFPIKSAVILGYYLLSTKKVVGMNFSGRNMMTSDALGSNYTKDTAFYITSSDYYASYGKKSDDGKTFFWYTNNDWAQVNDNQTIYYVLAIG